MAYVWEKQILTYIKRQHITTQQDCHPRHFCIYTVAIHHHTGDCALDSSGMFAFVFAQVLRLQT